MKPGAILFLLLFSFHVTAAESFSPQLLDISARAGMPTIEAPSSKSIEDGFGEGGPPSNIGQKTLANGLYMTGQFTYQFSGNQVSVTLDGIVNDSFTRTSGTLRVELWATVVRPGRAQGFSGYKLAQSSLLDPMPPRTFYSNLAETVFFEAPPNGT